MPIYLIENHAGLQFEMAGPTLAVAKIKLCKRLEIDWKDPHEGARSMKLVEVLEEAN